MRPYKDGDLPHLQRVYSESGFDFPFPDLSSPLVGHLQVCVDDEDVPLMAACVKMVPEVILLCPRGAMHPVVKMQGIGLIHNAMRKSLEADGHDEAFCFVPPEIEKSYGNHLQRKFGWARTWASFRIGRTS